jgi:hypothetical protein
MHAQTYIYVHTHYARRDENGIKTAAWKTQYDISSKLNG